MCQYDVTVGITRSEVIFFLKLPFGHYGRGAQTKLNTMQRPGHTGRKALAKKIGKANLLAGGVFESKSF